MIYKQRGSKNKAYKSQTDWVQPARLRIIAIGYPWVYYLKLNPKKKKIQSSEGSGACPISQNMCAEILPSFVEKQRETATYNLACRIN